MPQTNENPRQRASGWSSERRAKHAAAIRRWKPWMKSTGPKTAAGKARAAQNAYKHGGRARPARLLHEALAAQRSCVRHVVLYARLRKNATNELLARIRSRIHLMDRTFHVRLYQSLNAQRLCKNLAFLDPIPIKVNANDND
jgi:hypothetical protein